MTIEAFDGLNTLPQAATAATIGVEGEDWLVGYRDLLLEDGVTPLPIEPVLMQEEFDPNHSLFPETLQGIEFIHRAVASGAIDQVHFTRRVAKLPVISILMSSCDESVQFIELDGEF